MKKLKNEIRMAMAEFLLEVCIGMAPKTSDGERLVQFILGYFQACASDKK